MKKTLILLIFLILIISLIRFSSISQVYALRPLYSGFNKNVITPELDESLRYFIHLDGSATRVTLVIDSQTGEERDLTNHGNGTWSTYLSPEFILKNYDETHPVNKLMVSTYRIYDNSVLVSYGPVRIEVLTPDIPIITPEIISDTIQVGPNIVNIVDDEALTNKNNVPIREVFYTYFSGVYDFLNMIWYKGYHENRFYMGIQKDIQGIGENLYDFRLSEAEGQLKGIIYYPLPMYFHGALNSYSHEIGHHWINYLNFDPFNLGGGPHWPIGSLPRSIIGYNYPGGGQGLNYPWDLTLEGDGYRVSYNTTADDYFHDIDLYLMGLLPADEANSVFFIAENQYQTDQLTNGGFIEGPFINVDVDDIIDEFGPRIPGYPTSQKKFSVGTIVVSSKLLSIEEISLYNYYSKCAEAKNSMYVLDQWQNPFYVATNGFGEIDSSIYEYSPTSIPEEKTFDIPVNQDTYTVSTFSNSTVTTVVFNQTLKRLRFNVEGDAGTVGLCNITVPSELMSGDFSVCLDDVLLVEGVDYTESSNGTHYLFSIRYEHSSHILDIFSINVIPDFSNLLFLLFLFSATLLGFTLKKRLMQKKGNCG